MQRKFLHHHYCEPGMVHTCTWNSQTQALADTRTQTIPRWQTKLPIERVITI